MSKQANPLDSIARWTPPTPNAPIPKPSRAAREKAKAEKRESVEQIKRDASKAERSKVSKRFRSMIFERDGHRCRKCGANPVTDPSVVLVLAHVQPIAQGGTTTEQNCQCWCFDCNSGQGARRVRTPEEEAEAEAWRQRKDAECRERVQGVKKPKPIPPPAFNERDCSGVFDGNTVTSDADPGL